MKDEPYLFPTDQYPKFKGASHPTQSFTTAGTIYVTDDYIQVPFGGQYQKINKLRRGTGRPIEGSPREVTISRSATGKYWASVCCKVERDTLPIVDGEVGISLGLKELAIDSNGVHYENPKHLSKSAKRLAREQRRLSRKKKGSVNYEKQRRKVLKLVTTTTTGVVRNVGSSSDTRGSIIAFLTV